MKKGNVIIAVLLISAFVGAFALTGFTVSGAAATAAGNDLTPTVQQSCVAVSEEPSCGCGCGISVEQCRTNGCPTTPGSCPGL